MSEVLSVWVVCKHPSDYPDKYTAREHLVIADAAVDLKAKNEVLVAARLQPLRLLLAQKGLTRMPPDPNDDPVILEVWL
jgi:hypothetical protein